MTVRELAEELDVPARSIRNLMHDLGMLEMREMSYDETDRPDNRNINITDKQADAIRGYYLIRKKK